MSTESTDLDKLKGREILELKVNEISVVDRPAILREFLIAKRLQEDSMGAFESESTISGEEMLQEALKGLVELQGVEWLEVGKAEMPADLKTAIQRVSQYLGKVVKGGKDAYPSPAAKDKQDLRKELPADLKTAIQRVIQFLGKVASGKYPYPAAASMRKQDEEEDDEEKKKAAAAKEEEEKEKAKSKEEEAKEEEAKKSVGGQTVVIRSDGTIEVSGQDVTKGKSQFTTDRTDALKSSVGQLLNMLATVDKEAAKKIVDELCKTVLPGDVKWTSGTTATPASVRKTMEEVLEPIAKQLQELGVKVETIEKARPASQSGEGEDTTLVQKKKSPWDGLPLG